MPEEPRWHELARACRLRYTLMNDYECAFIDSILSRPRKPLTDKQMAFLRKLVRRVFSADTSTPPWS